MIEVRSDISYDVMHEAMTGFAVEKKAKKKPWEMLTEELYNMASSITTTNIPEIDGFIKHIFFKSNGVYDIFIDINSEKFRGMPFEKIERVMVKEANSLIDDFKEDIGCVIYDKIHAIYLIDHALGVNTVSGRYPYFGTIYDTIIERNFYINATFIGFFGSYNLTAHVNHSTTMEAIRSSNDDNGETPNSFAGIIRLACSIVANYIDTSNHVISLNENMKKNFNSKGE